MPNPKNETMSFSIPKSVAKKARRAAFRESHGWLSQQVAAFLAQLTKASK
jgi:hypothetical protein